MFLQRVTGTKNLRFERRYDAPVERVWRAWTDADEVKQWWGPQHTVITDCEIDPQVGGEIYIVMEADAGMGKYQGTRWPMRGRFDTVTPAQQMVYTAQSWTEGKEADSLIDHTTTVAFRSEGDATVLHLDIEITKIGPKAKMAAFGMRMGYKQYLKKLETHIAR